MDLALTEDQRAIKESFAKLFERESPPERVRAALEPGFDERLWRLVSELGLVGIAVPEELGGAGAGLLDLTLVAEDAGRRLACIPLAEAAITARMLAAAVEAPGVELLPRVCAGELVAVLCPRPAADGVAVLVPGGAIAHAVVALDGDELVLVQGPPGDPVPDLGFAAVADRPLRGEAVRRQVLLAGEQALRAFERAVAEWRVVTAGVLSGLAAEAVAIGVRYASERVQFGVPIGAFQAVQHPLADAITSVDGAELLARKAAWAADHGLPSWTALAGMAFAHAAETAEQASTISLHVHGGYGYTLEYDIHLYLRRAKALRLSLGDPDREWEAVGAAAVAA